MTFFIPDDVTGRQYLVRLKEAHLVPSNALTADITVNDEEVKISWTVPSGTLGQKREAPE